MTQVTAAQLQAHAQTLAGMASALLTGLAAGKYDPEVAVDERLLSAIGVVFPPAAMAEEALAVFLELNKLTAPRAPIVPDRRGGYVPNTNSRVMPDGSLRPYDPAIDR
jgi:hypothetical protein